MTQATIHGGDISCVLTCHCRLGNVPMLLTSTKVSVICAHCCRAFDVTSARFTPQEGLHLEVSSRLMTERLVS